MTTFVPGCVVVAAAPARLVAAPVLAAGCCGAPRRAPRVRSLLVQPRTAMLRQDGCRQEDGCADSGLVRGRPRP